MLVTFSDDWMDSTLSPTNSERRRRDKGGRQENFKRYTSCISKSAKKKNSLSVAGLWTEIDLVKCALTSCRVADVCSAAAGG